MEKEKDKEENVVTEDELPELGIKKWIVKSVSVTIILMVLVFAIQQFLMIQVLVDTLLAITIVLSIAFVHEALHYYEAVKLGYRPKWWRTRFRMGFEISHHSERGKWLVDKKKIARIPYYFAIPVSVALIPIGYVLGFYGIMIAGIGSLILHGISFPLEGKDA